MLPYVCQLEQYKNVIIQYHTWCALFYRTRPTQLLNWVVSCYELFELDNGEVLSWYLKIDQYADRPSHVCLSSDPRRNRPLVESPLAMDSQTTSDDETTGFSTECSPTSTRHPHCDCGRCARCSSEEPCFLQVCNVPDPLDSSRLFLFTFLYKMCCQRWKNTPEFRKLLFELFVRFELPFPLSEKTRNLLFFMWSWTWACKYQNEDFGGEYVATASHCFLTEMIRTHIVLPAEVKTISSWQKRIFQVSNVSAVLFPKFNIVFPLGVDGTSPHLVNGKVRAAIRH